MLPDGSASDEDSTAGTQAAMPYGAAIHGGENLAGALSADGSRVFWSAFPGANGLVGGGGPGSIYLRLNADRAPTASGECDEVEPQGACTLAVSGALPGDPVARFWAADPQGSRRCSRSTGRPGGPLPVRRRSGARRGRSATQVSATKAVCSAQAKTFADLLPLKRSPRRRAGR